MSNHCFYCDIFIDKIYGRISLRNVEDSRKFDSYPICKECHSKLIHGGFKLK